jgi:hypothetical protein
LYRYTAALVAAVEECRANAKMSFDDQVSQRGERLRKAPPPPTDSLAPPPFVAEVGGGCTSRKSSCHP